MGSCFIDTICQQIRQHDSQSKDEDALPLKLFQNKPFPSLDITLHHWYSCKRVHSCDILAVIRIAGPYFPNTPMLFTYSAAADELAFWCA